MIEGAGKTPGIISDLHSQVESFKRKLEVRWGWLKPVQTPHFDPVQRNFASCPAECGTPKLDGSVSRGC